MSEDRSERRDIARALQAAVAVKRDGLGESLAVSRLALRAYRELSDPQLKEAIARGLVENYPHPGTVPVVADAMTRTSDRSLYRRGVRWLTRIASARHNRFPPWAVLSWDAVQQALRQLKQGLSSKSFSPADLRRMERDLDEGLAGLEAQRKLSQRRQLRDHLDVDERPRPGGADKDSLGYFIGCLMGSDDPQVQRDCAAGIHWLGLYFAEQRRRAVAAAAGLVQQKRHRLHRDALEALESLWRNVSSNYRGSSARGSCAWWRGP